MSLINREELLAAIMDDGGLQYPRWWYADKVKAAPEVDAVEVVRCEDCKDYVWHPNFGHAFCEETGERIKQNDFCSRGERRDDGRPD